MALISSPRERASTPHAIAPAIAMDVQMAIDLGFSRPRPVGGAVVGGGVGGLAGVVVVTGASKS
ncbi:hypothetical protein Psuf_036610 [Phytohabitans suffuscus]|uniref:Uncharacterized protein n=1 Tax=Phytohabitans suffuscus TaxID=624315 RepID=A0A6F8YK67_9ACTN|nr:hypothetical protein Psuf_036610 [Phytohabitans suffuscus]